MNKFWEEMNKVDRRSFMESLYFDPELGNLTYIALPTHIRIALISVWNKKYKDNKKELNF